MTPLVETVAEVARPAGGGSVTASLFLELPLAREHVQVVSDGDGVRTACEWLRSAEAIGLDSEWRPNAMARGQPNPVALLQLACARRAFLFDMVALRADEASLRALDTGLAPLMGNASVPKLGYSVRGDFEKLRKSYALRAFEDVRGVKDVGAMHAALSGARRAPGGLAGLCKVQCQVEHEHTFMTWIAGCGAVNISGFGLIRAARPN